MSIKSNINKVVLMLTATLVISGCNSGKNKPTYDDPDIQLVELSDDEKSKEEVRYVMLHLKDFSFDESENGTFKVDDKMKHTQYEKIFEKDNYQDALGSIVTEIDKAKAYGIRMKLGERQEFLQEAVAEGFTQVNDSLYSKGKPKMSCISLSRYKGWPSLMLICY